MPADNEIYNQPGDIWRDERRPLHAIRTSLNPTRLRYFASVFSARGLDPGGKVIIDGGGGPMAEQIARLGASVIGIDPSAASIGIAQAHAAGSGLNINYRVGSSEHLPRRRWLRGRRVLRGRSRERGRSRCRHLRDGAGTVLGVGTARHGDDSGGAPAARGFVRADDRARPGGVSVELVLPRW
jgi:hypothetical protein